MAEKILNIVTKFILLVIGATFFLITTTFLFTPLVDSGNAINDSGMPLGSMVAGNNSVLSTIYGSMIVVLTIAPFIALIFIIRKIRGQ